MRKNVLTPYIILTVVILLLTGSLSVSLYSQQMQSGQTAGTVDPVKESIALFSVEVQLTPEQTEKVRSIFKLSEDQMKRDRQMFGTNIPALTEAARRRRDMTESHIKNTLTPDQQKKFEGAKHLIHISDDVLVSMEQMSMSYAQGFKTAEIFRKENKQEQIDRNTHRQSAFALISAARSRREMVDRYINSILNRDQQKKYFDYIQERHRDNEMFMLKHGLMLSPEQTARVEAVVDAHRKEMEAMMKKKRGMMQPRMGGGGMGGRGGGMGRGMNKGGMGDRGGMSGGMMGGGMNGPGGGMGGRMMGRNSKDMQKLQAKRQKAITELLEPHQLPLYNQLIEMMKQRREKRTKQRF